MKKLNKIIFIKDPVHNYILEEDQDVLNVKRELSNNEIEYNEIVVNEEVPDFTVKADLIIFDWGGLGTLGNCLFANFIKDMIKEAEERPNQLFLIYSNVLDFVLQDLQNEIDELPANVLCSFDELKDILQ